MKAKSMSNLIMPPAKTYHHARSCPAFNRQFQPRNQSKLMEVSDLPANPDERTFWTVVDLDPNSTRLHLMAGFRFANRLGFVETEHRWGGNPEDHPLYTY